MGNYSQMIKQKLFWPLLFIVIFGLGCAIFVYQTYLRTPGSDRQKMGYALGMQVGDSIMKQGVEIDPASLGDAVRDVMAGRGPRMNKDELEKALRTYQESIQKGMAEAAGKNLKDVEAFLKTNAGRKEVTSTSSGLQYEVLKKGSGKQVVAGDLVQANFRGTLMNGTEIESTGRVGHPVELNVDKIIPGLHEGLQLMQEGSAYRFFVPPNLAYGPEPRPGVPGNSLLIYEIEIVKASQAPAKGEGEKSSSKAKDSSKKGK